jgi:hypothetical protein
VKISTNGQHGWKLVYSGDVLNTVRHSIDSIEDEAKRVVVSKLAAQSLAHIKQDPLAAGGPRFRYHHLNLLNYVYTTEYFILHYAVDERRHLIYLRKFDLFD